MFCHWPALAPFAKKSGGIFYYDVPAQGAESAAAVFVHGLGDEADTWRHLLPLLAREGIRCLAPDLPGFGRSDGRATMKNHRDAVLEILEGGSLPPTPHDVAAYPPQRGVPPPATPPAFFLVGSSMGGVICQMAAAKLVSAGKPGALKALILVDGFAPRGPQFPAAPLLLSALPFAGRTWYRAFRQNHEGAWRSLFGYYADIEKLPAEDQAFLRQRVIDRVSSGKQEDAYFSSLRSMIFTMLFPGKKLYHGNRTSVLKSQAPVPKTLLIWGAEDRVVPLASAKIYAEKIGAELAVVCGAGHLPHQEKAAEVAAAILKREIE
jgi:pimeloyl-ACP methyl ester carboxylesterase